METIASRRLVVRPLTPADADFIVRLLNDPDWLRFIGDRGVKSPADAVRYIETGPMRTYAERGFGFCAVALKGEGAPLGICGLAKRDYLDDIDLGFAFLPEHRRRGYAFEASCAVLRDAQDRLRLTRVVAITNLDNLDSVRLLERLGFEFERVIAHPGDGAQLNLFAKDLTPAREGATPRPS